MALQMAAMADVTQELKDKVQPQELLAKAQEPYTQAAVAVGQKNGMT